MKDYTSPADALADLKNRGYEENFETEHFCLYCGDLDIRFDPEDFHIDEMYRFEDQSCANDSAIVYAISSSVGVKGTLISEYGAELDLKMACQLRIHPTEPNT